MTTKRRKRISGLVCPGCSEIGTLRKVVYGMPDPEEFDFEGLKAGVKVVVFYTETDGKRTINDLDVVA